MEKLGMRHERDTQHKGIGVVLYAIHHSPGTSGGLPQFSDGLST